MSIIWQDTSENSDFEQELDDIIRKVTSKKRFSKRFSTRISKNLTNGPEIDNNNEILGQYFANIVRKSLVRASLAKKRLYQKENSLFSQK
jgi:hypothetical protein